jgi:hypothetical protein
MPASSTPDRKEQNMSDKPVPPLPAGVSQEQWEKISGGDCTTGEITNFINELKQNYDTLVDFTSYVMEQVLD